MSTIVVTPSVLKDIALGVEELTGRYRQSISKLYNIGGELDGMWEGAANRQFMAQLGSDRERFDAMAKLMESYIGTLRNAAATYVNSESEAVTALNANRKF